jgi:hypothetical protein
MLFTDIISTNGCRVFDKCKGQFYIFETFSKLFLQIHIYSVATGERLRTLAHCSRTAHTCAYRLDGALIVVGDQDGDVHLLDAHGTGRAQLRHAHVHEG